MSNRPPVAAVVRPPGTEEVLPPGVDYPDELGRTPMGAVDDPISEAVGAMIFVERPGRSWVPWALRPTAAAAGLQDQVTFSRYYPKQRIAVDVFPNRANLEPARQSEIAAEVAFKRDLAARNAVGYVALHEGDRIDYGLFEEARKVAAQEPLPASVSTVAEPAAYVDPTEDPLSARLGVPGHYVHAGPPLLPWAYKYRNPDVEWTREALIFSRYYWSIPMLVDIFPRREYLDEKRREDIDQEIVLKRKLCHKAQVAYLVMWGETVPSEDEVALALRRAHREGVKT